MAQPSPGDVAPPEESRLVSSGQPGVRAAVALTLTRSILLIRIAGYLLGSVVALVLQGPDATALTRLGPSLGLVCVLTLAELRLLPRLGPGPPRMALIACEVLGGLALLVLGLHARDGVLLGLFVIFGLGTAALAGALLGSLAGPVWAGQAVQAVVTGWALLEHPDAPRAVAPLLLASPVLVISAGLGSVALGRSLLSRVQKLLESAHYDHNRAPQRLQAKVEQVLGSAGLAVIHLPGRRRPALAGELARGLTEDTMTALDHAHRPVRGLRLDDPVVDFATSLERLCREWSASNRVTVSTRLEPVSPPAPVRHALATIVVEALDNVAEHARATRAHLVLGRRGRHLVLSIEDNGGGFTSPVDDAPRAGPGSGLARMADQATGIGATLTIKSEPYSGTTVSIRMAS